MHICVNRSDVKASHHLRPPSFMSTHELPYLACRALARPRALRQHKVCETPAPVRDWAVLGSHAGYTHYRAFGTLSTWPSSKLHPALSARGWCTRHPTRLEHKAMPLNARSRHGRYFSSPPFKGGTSTAHPGRLLFPALTCARMLRQQHVFETQSPVRDVALLGSHTGA